MTIDIDQHLTPLQWDALKALRAPGRSGEVVEIGALAELLALGLATLSQGSPGITKAGRAVLLRGSPRLWDLAA